MLLPQARVGNLAPSTTTHTNPPQNKPRQVPTHNVKGLSWEYPLLDPALPLPPADCTHLGGDGSPSPAARRTASAPIDIARPAARRAPRAGSCCGSSCGSSSAGSPGAAASPGSASGGSSFGSPIRTAAGPFAVGCVAPSCFMWSELAQVVDLADALQQQSGLPLELAAAALSTGAPLQFSIWVAGNNGGRAAPRGGAAAAAAAPPQPPPASECQVVMGLVAPADAAVAAAEGVPLELLPKTAVPFADELPSGLTAAAAARAAAEAGARALGALGLSRATRLEVVGPFPAGPEWQQIKVRLRLPALGAVAVGADGRLANAPKLVIALRGRAGASTPGARGAGRGPKFMAARAVFVPLDDE